MVFRRDETGFTILELDEHPFTFKGVMFSEPGHGEEFEFYGRTTHHHRYGENFSFSSCRQILPSTEPGVCAYLQRHAPGIGPATAKCAWDRWGAETLYSLRRGCGGELPGITPEKAKVIALALIEKKEFADAEVDVRAMATEAQLPNNVVVAILERYRLSAAEHMRRWPYKMIPEISGLSFPRADEVARLFSDVGHNSPQRIYAGLGHVLLEASQDGHTGLHPQVLTKRTCGILDVPKLLVVSELARFDMFHVPKDDFHIVQLAGLAKAEEKVARFFHVD